MKPLILFAALFLAFSCNHKEGKKHHHEKKMHHKAKKTAHFEFATWMTSNKKESNEDYSTEFKRLKNGGIDEVLINTNTDPKELQRLVPLAKQAGLHVHAWIMAVNRPNDSVALQHPEWYMVSREGKSCFDTRPYVDYYQWLCPVRKASRNHILSLVEGLAKVKDVESVHLDYIRFPDIFLPIGLLPKYDLVQNTELPQFDFCYCDVCVSKFEKLHHKNPRKMKHPELDMEWKNFRLNAIRDLVNDANKIVKKYHKRLTAAVFPYPEMADHMVRQRWDKWNIDEVYPMIYHGFYNEEIDWVGYATQQGVADLKAKKVGLNTGVYLPDFKSPEALKQAIMLAKENGAKGVIFFDAPQLSDQFLETIKREKKEIEAK